MQGHGDDQQQQHIQEGSKCVNWKRGSMETKHGQEKLKKYATEKVCSLERLVHSTIISELEKTSRDWSQSYK